MKFLHPTTQFKKDLKRIRNNKKKSEALIKFFRLLENEEIIPEYYNKHKLTGDYNDCWECHIESDFLII